MNFTQFRFANTKRCREAFHPIDDWSATDWACAVGGEVGELQTLVCSVELGAADTTEIGKEVADIVAYLDLLCVRMGVDLEAMAVALLNEVTALKRGGAGFSVGNMTFARFQQETKESYAPLLPPKASLFFLACSLGAATGELLNVIKKLRRGLNGDKASLPELGRRAAQVLVSLSLLASNLNIDFEAVTILKFNKVSEKVGSKVLLK